MGGFDPADEDVSLDTSVPHISRVYDYWLGGKDNFAADQTAAEQVIATFPDIWCRSTCSLPRSSEARSREARFRLAVRWRASDRRGDGTPLLE